jgi:hypothetical protein
VGRWTPAHFFPAAQILTAVARFCKPSAHPNLVLLKILCSPFSLALMRARVALTLFAGQVVASV